MNVVTLPLLHISNFHEKMARPSRIAFGSCNDQTKLNPFWPILEQRKPAAFIWGGDAIYSVSSCHCTYGNLRNMAPTTSIRLNDATVRGQIVFLF
jgi:hypothetical protein